MSRTFVRAIAIILLAGLSGLAGAQSFTENFDNITQLAGSGWVMSNNSSPVGSTGWLQGTPVASSGPFDAYNGAANAYIAANYNNTGSNGTISNWLMMPNRTLRNGDVLQFYTRKPIGQDYPDRLEVRLSTNGASTNAGVGAAAVGDFTTLMLSINPTLVTGVYPTSWTQYTITMSGLPAPTSGRMAFRYYVTGAGSLGTNSDYIGIDNTVYTPYVCPTFTMTPGGALVGGTWGQAYSTSLTQTGALGTPTYVVTAGGLPPGMTVSAAGTISGTPFATGTFNFTITVYDASGCSGSQSYSITVVPGLPGPPQSVSASAGDAQVDVTFAAPGSDGGDLITGYTATCTDGANNVSASGAASPIPVTGLTNGTAYTCTVAAINGAGPGAASDPSNSVTPMGNQTITFGAQAGQVYSIGGTFPVNPLAMASSGLAVTYGSSTTGVCTVSGTIVSMVSVGTCTLTADQPGDNAWNAAPQVSQSLTISPSTVADLWVQKTVDKATALIGDTVTYTILVGNDGLADAVNVHVLDTPPDRLAAASVTWQCLAATGTVCPVPSSGTGALDVTIASLPKDAVVQFTLLGQVILAASPVDDYTTFFNTATVALPPGSGLTDPAANDQSTAGVTVLDIIFANGFEGSVP